MAWIIPLATAVYGAISSHHAATEADKARKRTEAQQKDIYGQLKPTADQYTAMGKSALSPTLNYYMSLLGGNRYAMNEALAPELNAIGEQFQGSATNSHNLYGRGGGGPSQAQNVRDKYNSAVTNTTLGARPGAASALGGLGVNLANLGYQGYGQGVNTSNSIFQNGMQGRQEQYNYGKDAGQGLFNAYQAYMLTHGGNATAGTPGMDKSGVGGGAAGKPMNSMAGGPSMYGGGQGIGSPPNSGSTRTNLYTPFSGSSPGPYN